MRAYLGSVSSGHCCRGVRWAPFVVVMSAVVALGSARQRRRRSRVYRSLHRPEFVEFSAVVDGVPGRDRQGSRIAAVVGSRTDETFLRRDPHRFNRRQQDAFLPQCRAPRSPPDRGHHGESLLQHQRRRCCRVHRPRAGSRWAPTHTRVFWSAGRTSDRSPERGPGQLGLGGRWRRLASSRPAELADGDARAPGTVPAAAALAARQAGPRGTHQPRGTWRSALARRLRGPRQGWRGATWLIMPSAYHKVVARAATRRVPCTGWPG